MKTEVWRLTESADSKNLIRKAAEYIKSGKLVVFPTETVYGIGALADDRETLDKIYQLKDRPENKPFAWHLGGLESLKKLPLQENPSFEKVAQLKLPGPITSLVNSTAGEKIGIRIPDDPVGSRLLREAGGLLLATSANPSGQPSATEGKKAFEYFDGKVDLILDTGKTRLAGDSAVVDFTCEPFKILRTGVYSHLQQELEKILHS